MITIILLFLVIGFMAYLFRNPVIIGGLLVIFLGIISIFTPFWPFVLLGLFAMSTAKRT